MDFDAALSFLRVEIDKDLKGKLPVPKGFLEQFVKEKSGISNVLDKILADRLIRYLETIYGTKQDDGHVLKTDFLEWYKQRKSETNYYFWRRLQKYWLDHSVLPVQVVSSIDSVTDEIMGYLGDPLENSSWRRRGLVMGHVQSGKTTNYSALIAKAADMGYRVIIVLAGLTNSLRYQTQVRLDQSFVGKSSLGDSIWSITYPVSNIFKGIEGDEYEIRHPYCGTTQASDFNVAKAKGIGATEGNFADPVLFVTKKNDKVLDQLSEWLKKLNQTGIIDGPMLLIDDEADNASIDTEKDPNKASTINSCIRNLLNCSRRSSYVGYTATPFANIFIDPDTTDDMLNNDLFPEHFIKSLEPADNYIGADKLFSEKGKYHSACIRVIPNDYQDLIPLKHKSGDVIKGLPISLQNAIYEYIIFRAIRILDAEGNRHSSMLVNVSRFNSIQKQVYEEIYTLLQVIKDSIDVWALSDKWNNSDILMQMYNVWTEEYKSFSGYNWDEIRKTLKKSISSIEVRLINMKGGSLNYDKAPESGLHIITIGGLALSRGLTLEGLAISYILRNVGAADTLLQMGRWFGYRPGYESLCRIHTTMDMLGHFREVNDSVEELRDDLVRMENMGLTPGQFGLKVRQSSTGIAITAANKMRTAKPLKVALDLSLQHLQAYELFNDYNINYNHYIAVESFFEELKLNFNDKNIDDKTALVWSGVNVIHIQKFLQQFQFPQLEFAIGNEGRNLVLDYISDRTDNELEYWDIAIPYKKQPGRIFPLNLNFLDNIFCRDRHSGVPKSDDPDVVKITEKNIVADKAPMDLLYGGDKDKLRERITRTKKIEERITIEKKCLQERIRPLLVIHLLDFKLDTRRSDGKKLKFKEDIPVVTLSLAFPSTKIKPIAREYAISVRMEALLKQKAYEAQTDEGMFDYL